MIAFGRPASSAAARMALALGGAAVLACSNPEEAGSADLSGGWEGVLSVGADASRTSLSLVQRGDTVTI